MLVSVVTAVRNGASTIGATLESVYEQAHADVEHIVVDGASTDATVELVRNGQTRGVRLLSEPDSGVYDAFNKGLQLASGEIIGFLNCGDTYWSRDIIARVAAEFSNPRLDAVFGDVAIVDAAAPAVVVRRYHSQRFRPSRLAYGLMPAHPSLFLRRAVYARFGGYDPSYRIAGDFELVARVFGAGAIAYKCLPQVLVRMLRGGLSSSGLGSNWIITREMRRACRENDIRTSMLKLALRFPIKCTEWLDTAV